MVKLLSTVVKNFTLHFLFLIFAVSFLCHKKCVDRTSIKKIFFFQNCKKNNPKNYLPARLRPFLDSQKLRITANKLQKVKNIKQDSSTCK